MRDDLVTRLRKHAHAIGDEAAHRIEVLEGAIKYGIGMIQGGFAMEAALEMDRRLDDPDFDFQNPTNRN